MFKMTLFLGFKEEIGTKMISFYFLEILENAGKKLLTTAL